MNCKSVANQLRAVHFHYVMGQHWSRLLRDYDHRAGRIWGLIPVWTAVAPYVFYRLRSPA